MKFPAIIPFFVTLLPLSADETGLATTVSVPPHPALEAPAVPNPGMGWLGIDVTKPDHTLSSHLPALPPGVGFLVKFVHDGGPAANGGLKEDDLLWKFDDQLLVNEAQLSTLLRLRKPGDEVVLTVFRRGGQMEIPVELGASPLPRPGDLDLAVEEAVFQSGEGPMRVINLADREAYISIAEGRAAVRKVGDGYRLTIHDAEGELIFDDSFDRVRGRKCGNHEAIPAEWRRRAYALRRGLNHALDGSISPQRQPRPRVVPPAGDSK